MADGDIPIEAQLQIVIYYNKIDNGDSIIHRPRLPSIHNFNVPVSL
jgi:hypothetical protein